MDGKANSFEQAAGKARTGVLAEFWQFLSTNKKWWLGPIVVVLMVFGLLMGMTGTAAAPFIYSIFGI